MLVASTAGPSWAVIAAEAVVGVGIVIGALVKLVPQVRQLWLRLLGLFDRVDDAARAKIQLRESLRDGRRVRSVDLLLDMWVRGKPNIQRALQMTANNGGEAWKSSKPLEVNCQRQRCGPGQPDTTDLWTEWRPDSYYVEFLGWLLEAYEGRTGYPLYCPEVENPADKNQVHGELRRQYLDQGTVCSLVLPYAWESDAVLRYVSLNFGRKPVRLPPDEDNPIGRLEPISPETRAHFEAAMHELFDNPATCRGLIEEIKHAYYSVR
jgi:hypothetical protein